ncbi:MAG: FIST C-terminal domain-containing protein [Microthrixaceae bacterium]|nr:FIST C-terminal domain-containing protein [Acidimicrobiales bacterium]MCB9405084.1 FIST C-terminal domain-containing protein [Microthrixaceae bacterium]
MACGHDVEKRAAVALFAASWEGRMRTGPRGVRTVRFDARRDGDGWRLNGTEDVAVDGATLLLVGDPYSFPVDGFLDRLRRQAPGLTVIGGMASAARGPGGNHLVADASVVNHGAVGIVFPPGVPLRTYLAQGCRPIGEPLVVTASRGNLVEQIAGRPALDHLTDLIEGADHRDRMLMGLGLHLGLAAEESSEVLGAGDFLIRDVLGMQRASRSVAVGGEVPIGTTVQFHLRDPLTAEEQLAAALQGEAGGAGLVFCGEGRGEALFGTPHRDAELVHEHLRRSPTAGMFCSGEIGPSGSQSLLHTFASAVLVLD